MSSAVRNLGLMVMGHPTCSSQTRVACGIDFGAIAAIVGVWEEITTHPEAEHERPADRLMPLW